MAFSFFKKIRVFSWTSKAFLRKYGQVIALSLIIGLAGFFLISKISPYLPKPKKHERIGLVGKYTLDQLPHEILILLGQGLTLVAKDGSVVSGLASSWTVSEDGLSYTFTLKDNIYWQDDQKMKAEDIVYDFKDVNREVIDDKTLKFSLKESFAPFLIAVSKPVFKQKLIGSGPYKIEIIKKSGNYIRLLKLSGPAKDITFRFYPTVEAVKLAFKLGEIDIIDGLFVNPFEEDWQKYFTLDTLVKKDRYIGLFFNNEDSFLGNKALRQALSYAIKDKPKDETKAIGPLNPDSWAYNLQVKTYNYDPKNARELLKKFKEDDDEEIKIKISTSQAFLSLAEEIKYSWEEVLDIKVEIEVIDIVPQDYQVFLGIQEIPADPDQYALWHSTRAENITHFKDPRIDKLLEDGRRILTREKRKEKYFDFQRFLLEESPVAFLSHPLFFKIIRKPIF